MAPGQTQGGQKTLASTARSTRFAGHSQDVARAAAIRAPFRPDVKGVLRVFILTPEGKGKISQPKPIS